MAYTLKVTPEKLTAAAQQFQTRGSSIRNLTSQMLSLVKSLNSAWESPAQQTFVQKFSALDGDMAQIQEKINEHVRDLNQIANDFKTSENSKQSTASGLKTDYIHFG